MTLTQLQTLMADLGCNRILAKELSANDNSKNQVYLGGGFEAVNCFPNLEITQDATGSHGVLFKSSLRFFWVNDDGIQNQAPATQLILYPQYPEVRMSGFLKGCKGAPSRLMASRLQGRILFLGIKGDGDVFGYVSAPDDALTSELLASKHGFETEGVFTVVPTKVILTGDSRIAMMDAFRRIHLCGWIDSKKQRADGSSVPYRAPNGGGYTLEAELGITPNGYSEPDYLGWEVKQHSVVNFKRMGSSILTLMTPEPTAGLYKDGASGFMWGIFIDPNGGAMRDSQ